MTDSVYVIELEEKVKAYRIEIERKDELVRKLSRFDQSLSDQHICSMDISPIKIPTEEPDEGTRAKREELAILRSKVENLCDKTLSQETEIKANKTIISRLEEENEKLKRQMDEWARKEAALGDKLSFLKTENDRLKFEKVNESNQVGSVTEELEKHKKLITELESRLRHQTTEKERLEYEASNADERLAHFVSQMIRIFETYCREEDLEGLNLKDETRLNRLIKQASSLVDENLKNRGHIQELTDRITDRDRQIVERNRVVDRLGDQLTRTSVTDRESRDLTQVTLTTVLGCLGRSLIRAFIIDRTEHNTGKQDEARSVRKILKSIGRLNTQLECSRGNERAMESRTHKLTSDLMDSQVRIRELERQLSQAVHEKDHSAGIRHELAEKDFILFKDAIASILSSPHYPCSPTEVAIKEHARRLVAECKEQKELCMRLEARLSEVSTRWDSVQATKHEVERQVERTERENHNIREHVRHLESELTGAQLLREEQRAERERFFFYLCKLAVKAKIDQSVASRMQLEELEEAIFTRVDQITSGEFTLLTDVQANADRVAGLTRRAKRLQDQLASKEIQLGLWREKAAKLEAKLTDVIQTEADIEAQRSNADRAILGERRTEQENSRLRDEINRLRAELLDLNDAKVQCVTIGERVEELRTANEELERLRERQATKIAELLGVVEKQHIEIGDNRSHSDRGIDRVMEELNSARKTIEQLRRSERELFEFRSIVGRLLGLNVDALAVPNYDIVNSLESLVGEHRPCTSVENYPVRRVAGSSPVRSAPGFMDDSVMEPGAADAYVARFGLAKAGTKEARNPPMDRVRSSGALRSSCSNKLYMPEKREKSPQSPKLSKRDPRRY